MKQINIAQAKAQLSELVNRAVSSGWQSSPTISMRRCRTSRLIARHDVRAPCAYCSTLIFFFGG